MNTSELNPDIRLPLIVCAPRCTLFGLATQMPKRPDPDILLFAISVPSVAKEFNTIAGDEPTGKELSTMMAD